MSVYYLNPSFLHCSISILAVPSTGGTEGNSQKPKECKNGSLGNLTLTASHTAVIKPPPLCPRWPSGGQGWQVYLFQACSGNQQMFAPLMFISSASGLSPSKASVGNPSLGEKYNSGHAFFFPFIQVSAVRLVRTWLQLIMPCSEYSPRICYRETSKPISSILRLAWVSLHPIEVTFGTAVGVRGILMESTRSCGHLSCQFPKHLWSKGIL